MLHLAALAGAAALALSFPATVDRCHDGDTCRLRLSRETSGIPTLWLSVRLAAIDAPEVPKRAAKAGKGGPSGPGGNGGQPGGFEARDALNALLEGKAVTATQVDLDHYNRPVVVLLGPDNLNVNLWLVEKGYAEVYQGPIGPKGDPAAFDRGPYLAAEARAKASKFGIWALKDYMAPKLYREQARTRRRR